MGLAEIDPSHSSLPENKHIYTILNDTAATVYCIPTGSLLSSSRPGRPGWLIALAISLGGDDLQVPDRKTSTLREMKSLINSVA